MADNRVNVVASDEEEQMVSVELVPIPPADATNPSLGIQNPAEEEITRENGSENGSTTAEHGSENGSGSGSVNGPGNGSLTESTTAEHGSEHGSTTTKRVIHDIVCVSSATALIWISALLMTLTDNSIRQHLNSADSSHVQSIIVAVLVSTAYPLTIIFLAFIIHKRPRLNNKLRWLKTRGMSWFMDIVLFVLSAYIGQCVTDGWALAVSYILCLHIIPMANFIGFYENIGLFDGILSMALGATLTVLSKRNLIRFFAVLAFAVVYFTFRHLSELYRSRRNKKQVPTEASSTTQSGTGNEARGSNQDLVIDIPALQT